MPIQNTDAILAGPKLKIKRAYRHIDSIREATEPLSTEWYAIENQRRIVPPYMNRYEFILAYRPTQPIIEELALMIGDAVHNFRSALDHLAVGIVRTKDPTAKPSFPMSKNRKELPAHRDLPAIEQALPGATDLLLKKIRPENGSDEALWIFFDLDNDDKHNALIPVVTMGEIRNFNARTGGLTINNSVVGGDASKPINLIKSVTPITVQNDLQATVNVSFGKGNPFENESVVPTLFQVGNLVTETVKAFEGLMRK